jgi:hypothetical protein
MAQTGVPLTSCNPEQALNESEMKLANLRGARFGIE